MNETLLGVTVVLAIIILGGCEYVGYLNGMLNVAKGEKMISAFGLVKFGTKMSAKQEKVRDAFKVLGGVLDDTLKDNREKAQAKTEIEAAYIWASRSIRAEQLERNAAKATR